MHGSTLRTLQLCASEYTSDETNLVVDESEGAKKLRFPNTPPIEIAILAGEIVYHLRSALDHLVFELVKSNPTGATLPNRWREKCQFPLCLNIPKDANGVPLVPLPSNFFKALPNITSKAFAVIEGLQPYNGGGWSDAVGMAGESRQY